MRNSDKQVNRRDFFKKTAAGAAGLISFPYFIRPSALGKWGSVSPSNRIVMGVIGCGAMGSGNTQTFLNNFSDVQIAAVCDVDRERSESLKREIDRKYGNSDCAVYGDFREMIARGDLDAVNHAVPDHWHALVAVTCARAGLDIYGEKPLARTIREARAICDAVKRYEIVWQTGSWQRSVWNFHRACELVRNGRIGKVSYVEVGLPDGNPASPRAKLLAVPDTFNYEMWLGPAPWRPYHDFGRGTVHWDWRWIMDYSGGQLTDWAGHHIDIAHWGLGLDYSGPVEIEGKGKYYGDGIYNTPYEYEFVCTYENGLQMKVASASRLPKGMGTAWYGTDGWIHVDRGDILRASRPEILQEVIRPEESHLYYSPRGHHGNFIDCIRSRKMTAAPAEIAHRSISVGLLGEIAMLTGRKLKWDLKTETFVNDEGAGRYLARSFRSPWHL
jgi:predicted dehydrogenase